MVIGREGEVGADTAVGEDDGAAFEHVEAIGGRRGSTQRGRGGVREGEGEGEVFGARVRVGVGVGFGGRGGG